VVDLAVRTWEQVCSDGVGRTNNATERIIGLDYAQHGQAHKVRVKAARGFKAMEKILCHCYLSEYLRGSAGGAAGFSGKGF